MTAGMFANIMQGSQRRNIWLGMMVLFGTASVVEIMRDPQQNSMKKQWDWMNNTPNTPNPSRR